MPASIRCGFSTHCRKSARSETNWKTLALRTEVLLTKAFADPVVRKRMTRKYMLDVFGGSGFVAKATNHFCLHGYVLDTKFEPRYDVTKPLVLTRIRQDVCGGKCVAATISPPRLHTSCSSQSDFRLYGHRKLASSCSDAVDSGHTRVFRGCWTCQKSKHLRHSLARLGPWRIFAFWDHRAGSGRCLWWETWTADMRTVLLANVLEQEVVAVFQDKKHVHRKGFRPHAQTVVPRVTTPALTVCLSRLSWFSPSTHEDS